MRIKQYFSHFSERRQSGDTIIEVLIAIAVVSIVLTVSYAAVNNSTKMTQDAQEHSEALKLAQSQIEFIRANGSPGANCFSQVGVGTAGCTVNAGGTTPLPGQLSFVQLITGPDGNGTYTVAVKWTTNVGANNTAALHLYYRRGN